MKTANYIFVISVFLLNLLPASLKSQNKNFFFGDSTLYALSMTCYDSIKSDFFFEMQKRGLKEADAKKNEHFQFVFRMLPVNRYEVFRDKENLHKSAFEVMEYYKKNNIEKELYTIWSYVVDRYSMWGDIDKAIEVNKEMSEYALAHNHKMGIAQSNFYFAQSYLNIKQWSEATIYYKKAFSESLSLKLYATAASSAFNLINIYSTQGRYSEALALSDSIPSIIRSWEDLKGVMNPVFRVKNAMYKLMIYVKLGDKKNATLERDSTLYYNNIYSDYALQYHINYGLAAYNILMGNYNEAISSLNSLIIDLHQHNNYKDLSDCRALIADAYTKNSDYALALKSYKRYMIEKDSANIETSLLRLDFLTKTFKLRELQQDKQLMQEKQQKTMLLVSLLSIILILIALLCVLLILNRRKLLQRNRELVVRIRSQEDKENKPEIRNYILETSLTQNRDKEIFDRINRLLMKEEVLMNPNLNRDYLASQLNTNRTYIVEAIRNCTNENVSEFINHSRCKYARRMLDSDPTLILEKVAFDAGFGSSSSFSNSFRKIYGISPREYKRAIC